MSAPEAGLRQAVILVGGQGTRLGALTRDKPKPLLDVAGRPFLAWLLGEIARHGFEEAVLLSGYRAEQVAALGDGSAWGLRLTHVAEPEPAGTAGALAHARGLLDEQFLLLNGDSFFDINLLDLASDSLATLALRPVADAARYGRVEADGGRVTAFREKQPGSGLINGGVYRLNRAALDRIGAQPCSLERDVLPALVAEGAVDARVYDRPFIDIGVPEALAEAQSFLPAVTRRGAVFFDRDGVLNRDTGYAYSYDALEWLPGAFEAVKRVNDAGLYAFVVTNQGGVARGYYREEDVIALHAAMQAELRRRGAHIDAWEYCPHHPEGDGAYRRDCDRRKPGPGMLRDLMAAWPVDPAWSVMIGDKPSDLEAARAAGVRGVEAEGDLDALLARLLPQLGAGDA